MKKIISTVAFFAILMASCQKETEIVDQAISTSLDLNSSDELNTSAESNAYELGRKKKHGKDSSCKRIPLEKLTQSILDYIALNLPTASIEIALRDRAGNFYTILKLEDGTVKILQFDADGNFVKELDKKVCRPKDPRKDLTKLDPTTLLPVIVAYIDSNYSSAVILNAGATPGGEILVIINFNGSRKALLFDANGNFIKELR